MKKNLLPLIPAVILLMTPAALNALPSDTAHWYMKHSYDVLNYKLNFDVYPCYTAPFPKTFAAKEEITLRVDSALSKIKLNAVNNSLQIDSVRMAGVSFTHARDTLTVQLNRNYMPGEQLTVRISYSHKNVTDNAFYVSNGFVFTDFPPEGARKVFPCWDRPSDKALTDITVKVPSGVRLGSTGHLADSTLTGDTLVYHWISTDPVSTYLVTFTSKLGFGISKLYWHQLSNPADSLPILLYYNSGDNISSARNTIPLITNFYATKFGPYPFEKIGFATLNGAFLWGGMENQTMVNLQPGGYSDNSLLAHEHSHQWFGDLITCGTWADIWLNEGFGTYSDKLYMENTGGYYLYKTAMNGLANYYLGHNPGLPIYNPSWAITTPSSGLLYHSGLIYDKGACVLHQLRYVLGDSVFFLAMNRYATDTALMYGNAVTEDFIAHVNQAAGASYQWFFDEWVYSPNHPVYANTYNIRDLGAGQWRVDLELKQTQTNTVFFRMPAEIKVTFADATDTLFRVDHSSNPQEYSFYFTKQPLSLSFDPNRNILLKVAGTVVGIDDKLPADGKVSLQSDPNPFRGSTRIKYSLPADSHVRLSVTDSSGKLCQLLVNFEQKAGTYGVDFLSDGLEPGMYLLQLTAGNINETRRIVLLK
jgi:aminopeptidase N